MKINAKGTRLDLTPALVDYVEEKMRSLEKIIQGLEQNEEAEVYVEISRLTQHHRHGDVYHAEANVNLRGDVIRAETDDKDARAAIDKMKDKLKVELGRFKEKQIENDRNSRPDKK